MYTVLPLILFALIMFCLVARGSGYRRAFLGAAVCFGLLLTAATELLSLFSALRYPTLVVFWGGVSLVAGLCLLPTWACLKTRKRWLENPGFLVGICAVLATTLLIALVSPPNNYDSMTYHMARVVHWIQNRSVAHYPTHITRQLYSAPWAEYAIMHLQVLSGGDRFANLVQWFSLCGCITGTSLIVREFGATARIQALAAVITVTIPMGILQASSTQNDLVVSFWLVCFVYFGILLVTSTDMLSAVACGGSLGLAILTKGTAYLFALPFLIWMVCAGIKLNRYTFIKPILAIGAMALTLNAGHYWRNYALWGNPLTTDSEKLTNDRITFQSTVSNLTRNIASNTWTPIPYINKLQFQCVAFIHESLGIGLSDPATSLDEESFTPRKTSLDEDYAGNGLHLSLGILAMGALIVRRNSLSRSLLYYTLSLTSGFLLFCVLLKWQPWGTRLMLPLFVLASPLIAVALPLDSKKWLVSSFATFMLLCSVPWLLGNQTRPLWGDQSILSADRTSLYFIKRPELESYYSRAAEHVTNNGSCDAIGILSSSGNAYEYPLWVLLNSHPGKMPRIEHLNVTNVSGSITLHDFRPCSIFEIL